MSIHNSNNTKYVFATIIVILFLISQNSEKYLQKPLNTNTYNKYISFGYPISSDIKPIPAITDLNQNTKSSKIQDSIFSTNKNNYGIVNKENDKVSSYLINVFCTETGTKYVKVASGSGVFLSNPDDAISIVLTNAHVARHLLDSNKKCVGRTGSPTSTTHTLTLRYIPYHWLNKHNQYVIGDPDQSSTGEYDFSILEAKKIKTTKTTSNIYTSLKISPKIKISNYSDKDLFNNTYIYSYPAQSILSKNVYSSLYQKKDTVQISTVYANPSENIQDSLLDVVGSKFVDHGSSGGLVISQGLSNSIIGLSSILIKKDSPQTVRVVTMKHVLQTIQSDLQKINNAQTDPFLYIIRDILNNKEVDMSLVQIFKNIKLTSVLEQYTRDTLKNLNIIR